MRTCHHIRRPPFISCSSVGKERSAALPLGREQRRSGGFWLVGLRLLCGTTGGGHRFAWLRCSVLPTVSAQILSSLDFFVHPS